MCQRVCDYQSMVVANLDAYYEMQSIKNYSFGRAADYHIVWFYIGIEGMQVYYPTVSRAFEEIAMTESAGVTGCAQVYGSN